MLETSSWGRLAKLPGLVLPDMLLFVETMGFFLVVFWFVGWVSEFFEYAVTKIGGRGANEGLVGKLQLQAAVSLDVMW